MSKQARPRPAHVDVFLDRTSLVVEVIVQSVLAERPHALTSPQVAWFIDHCDKRFRYLYALDSRWREWMEGRNPNIDPRDQCAVWIRHWLAAYTLDPARYQELYVAQED